MDDAVQDKRTAYQCNVTDHPGSTACERRFWYCGYGNGSSRTP